MFIFISSFVFLLLGKGYWAIAASCHGLPTSGYQITGIANRTVLGAGDHGLDVGRWWLEVP